MATGTNNSGSGGASTSKTIPCSQNLLDILNALTGDVEGASKNSTYVGIIPFTQELVKQIENVGKIKTDKLKDSVKNVKSISTAFKGFSKSLTELTNEILNGFKDIDTEQFKKISHILMSTETAKKDLVTKETQNEDGSFTKEYFKIKNPGVIETITAICGLADSLSKVKAPNYAKFKINFLVTLKMFKYSFKKISDLTKSLNKDAIKDIKETTEGLQMIMMELPMSVDLMVDMWKKQALQRKLVEWGINTVFGRNYDRKNPNSLGGALGGLILFGETIIDNKVFLNEDVFKSFEKTTKSASVSLFLLTNTLALLVVPGAFAWIGAWILFGRTDKEGKKGGGLLGYVIRGLRKITDNSQDLMKADKNILILAATIGMLALVAVAISVAAVLFVAATPALGIIALFMLGVNLMFWFISWVTKRLIIDQGVPKDIFLIAATVGLLALVAVAIAILGQYVKETSWDAVWSILLYMGALTLMFIGVSFASRIAGQASKDMLWIVASVGLLALIAVGLVYVGKEVETNWESLKTISLMMALITGMMISMTLLAKYAQSSKMTIIAIGAIVAALAGSMILFAKATQIVNDAGGAGKLLMVMGCAVGMFAIVTAIMVGLAAIINIPVIGPALAAGGGIALALMAGVIAVIALMGATIIEFAKAAKEIQSLEKLGIKGPKGLAEKLLMPLKALIQGDFKGNTLMSLLDTYSLREMTRMTIKIAELSMIAGSIGKMGEVLKNIASLNMPVEWGSDGRPSKFVKMKDSDFLTASLNAAGILFFFAALFSDKPTKTLKILGKTIKITPLDTSYVDNISGKTKRKTKKLADIVTTIGTMAETIQNVASLKIPKSYNTDGSVKDWVPMGAPEFGAATENVGKIMTTLAEALWGEKGNIMMDKIEEMKKRSAKKFALVMDPLTSLTAVVETIKMLADGQFVSEWKKDAEGHLILDESGNGIPLTYTNLSDFISNSESKIQSNLTSIFDVVMGAIAGTNMQNINIASGRVNQIKNILTNIHPSIQEFTDLYTNSIEPIKIEDFNAKTGAVFDKLTFMIDKIAATSKDADVKKMSQLQANIKETSNLLTKINTVDFNKLKYAYSLMSSISKLSQSINGNFQGLAKAINEDLLKALEELQKILNDIQTNGVSTKSSNSSSSLLNEGANNVKNGQATKTDANQNKEPKGNAKNDLSVLQQQLEEIQDLKNTLQSLIKNNSIKVIDTSKPIVFGQ